MELKFGGTQCAIAFALEVERGTCVYNATHVNKIQSVLGVKIPRV